ncbi:MAG: SPASM domain-containing protein, partial [Candidatus Omnitrophica bacterium]|nr:SPASM domain-containing protein [Candidatus Omnitrophota bacterium]
PFVMIQVIELASIKEGVDKNEKANFMNLFKGLPVNGFRFIVPHRFGGVIDKDVTGTDYAYMEREGALGYKYTPCPYPWYGMSIYYDGSVLPCCLNFFDNYIIGDANRQPLKEIWNGAPMVSLREKLSHERHGDISMCKQCDFLYQRSILGFSTKGLRDIATFLKEVSND